jgi:hypothetical protein
LTSDKIFSVDETNRTDNPKGLSHCSDLCRRGGHGNSRYTLPCMRNFLCLPCLFSARKAAGQEFQINLLPVAWVEGRLDGLLILYFVFGSTKMS